MMVTNNEAMKIKAGDSIELEIFDLNQHGQGVGRSDGLVVFVEDALPGETVQVLVDTVKKNYAVGVIKNIKNAAPSRVEPRCPLAGRCGGCAVQHMDYNAQLRWKQEHVASLFDRAGPSGWNRSKLQSIIGMDNPWYYRGKVQIPFSGSAIKPLAGFYTRRSHQVVDGEICFIQHPIADLIREDIRSYLREQRIEPYNEKTHTGTIRHIVVRTGFYTGQVMLMIVTNNEDLTGLADLITRLGKDISKWSPQTDTAHADDLRSQKLSAAYELTSVWLNINNKRSNVVMGPDFKLVYGEEFMLEEISGIKYRISPRAFFQVNPQQTADLYREVLEMAQLQGDETVLDLYCGTGSISLLLARGAAHVKGVELIKDAIKDAWLNAKMNSIDNVDFIAAAAENWLPEYLAAGGIADVAVIDPPRKGCDPVFIDALRESQIPVLIYVSCNPATLVRDLVALGSGYEIVMVRPVDMFPHSDSVECIVRLEIVNK